MLLFLGSLRSTFIAALAIPTSIIGTFMCMWWMGFTLNTITLLALALAVGIVIDDAIVVLENIFRYIEEKRVRPMPAAIYATKEIGLAGAGDDAVAAGGVPARRVHGGIPGRFLRSFGLTMGARDRDLAAGQLHADADAGVALAAPGPAARAERRKTILERFVDAFYQPIERAYMAMLRLLASPPLGGGAGARSATLVSMRAR